MNHKLIIICFSLFASGSQAMGNPPERRTFETQFASAVVEVSDDLNTVQVTSKEQTDEVYVDLQFGVADADLSVCSRPRALEQLSSSDGVFSGQFHTGNGHQSEWFGMAICLYQEGRLVASIPAQWMILND